MHLFILTGASRGMGLAMARQLLARDHHLLCISRRPDPSLDSVAAQQACTLEQWSLDLSQSELAAGRLKTWLNGWFPAEFKSITLINNAGVVGVPAPLGRVPLAEISHAMRAGLEATLLLTAR